MKQVFIMAHDVARDRAIEAVRSAPGGAMVVVSEASRSGAQNERMHAMVGEIAKQQTVMGRKLSAESWKRLLVDAFKHDTKDDPQLARLWAEVGDMQIAPALNHDGFVMLGEQTRKFPKLLASAFIEWLFAYGAEVGVTFRR